MAANSLDLDLERAGAPKRLWPLVVSDDRLVSSLRRGDPLAFDVLYERHSHELFVFCRRMLGSSQDAEDALQATFAKAHRALIADRRPIDVRPWLYAIARNVCLSFLRRRPAQAQRDLAGRPESLAAPHSDPAAQAAQRDEVRELLSNVIELPPRQREALVLAELHGMRHADVGEAMGVRPEQVKAYVHQARTNLLADREAQATDCLSIRRELDAGGSGRRRARVRRHLRACPGCRDYAGTPHTSRRGAAALLPLPLLASLRSRLLGPLLSRRGSAGPPDAAGALGAHGVEIGGAGGLAMAAKVLAGLTLLGAGAKLGTTVVERSSPPPAVASAAASNASVTASGAGALLFGDLAGAGIFASYETAAMRSPGSAPLAAAPGGPAQRGSAVPGALGGTGTSPGGADSAAGLLGAGPGAGLTVSGPTDLTGGGSQGEGAHGGGEAPRKVQGPAGSGEEGRRRSEEPSGRGGEEGRGRGDEAQRGEGRGRSEEAPGHTGEEAPAPGRGRSEEAPGHAGEGARGQEAPARGGESRGGESRGGESRGGGESPGGGPEPEGRPSEPGGNGGDPKGQAGEPRGGAEQRGGGAEPRGGGAEQRRDGA